MKQFKQLLHIFIVTSLLLGFVNCSFQNALSLKFSNASKLSGNGGGYEGKPDGTYYRYVPNYTCSGQPSPEGVAEIVDGKAYLYDNNSGQCSTQSSPLLATDINLSPFQNEFISIRDELFKRYETKPAGIPNSLAEILCRDDFEKPTFEIVSHYDRETNQAQSRVYFADHLQPDFQIGRILSATEVKYQSEQLQFKVDISKPAAQKKKFSGMVIASTISGVQNKNLTCVVGGSLDTSNWKLTQLSELETYYFSFFGKGEILFANTVSTFVHQMYKIAVDNSVTNFTEKLLGYNFDSQVTMASESPDLFIFQGRPVSDLFQSWFVYDQVTSKVIRLTNLNTERAQGSYLSNSPNITENRHLIYTENDNFFNHKYILHDLDLNTNSNYEIGVTTNGIAHITLKKTNRAILVDYSVKPITQVQLYTVATKSQKPISVQLPSDCQLDRLGMSGMMVDTYNNEEDILGNMTCGGTSDVHLVLFHVSTGEVREIALNKYIIWVTEDHKWLLLGDLRQVTDPQTGQSSTKFISTTPTAYNILTGQSFVTSVNPNHGTFDSEGNFVHPDYSNGDIMEFLKIASVENRWLYGFNGEVFNPTLYQTDLQTGLSIKSCENAQGRKLHVGALPNQKVYLLTYDSQLKAYRFYAVKSPTDCLLLNEFPSEHPSVTYLQSTTIGFAMSMGDGNMRPTREAVFVPTDGRPPLKMSYGDQGPWYIQVTPDKRRIILTGPAADGVNRIFSFDLFARQ